MQSLPPKDNEIEVSIFGPGYGESILIHYSYNNWIIIDSCIDRTSRLPASIAYLHKIGVDPSQAVKLIIATHWHDDHIRGLGTTLKTCESAEFVCSGAIASREFLYLVELSSKRKISFNTSGTEEFKIVFSLLNERNIIPKHAIADRMIWKEPSSKGHSCLVYSLSPSDKECTRANLSIAKLIDKYDKENRRIPSPKPNDSAIVLWVSVDDINILLGSDMEQSADKKTGWAAIVDSTTRPQDKASVFKVAHHGSLSGHFQPAWDQLLHNSPYALLTPFTLGNIKLPSSTDIERIANQTENAFLSSSPQKSKRKIYNPVVDKLIRKHTLNFRFSEQKVGQITLRKTIDKSKNKDWEVYLSSEAFQLSKLKKENSQVNIAP